MFSLKKIVLCLAALSVASVSANPVPDQLSQLSKRADSSEFVFWFTRIYNDGTAASDFLQRGADNDDLYYTGIAFGGQVQQDTSRVIPPTRGTPNLPSATCSSTITLLSNGLGDIFARYLFNVLARKSKTQQKGGLASQRQTLVSTRDNLVTWRTPLCVEQCSAQGQQCNDAVNKIINLFNSAITELDK